MQLQAQENAVDTIVADLEELALRIPPRRHQRHTPVTAPSA
jgi:hypothetical protein